jgi:hypothetical protein
VDNDGFDAVREGRGFILEMVRHPSLFSLFAFDHHSLLQQDLIDRKGRRANAEGRL